MAHTDPFYKDGLRFECIRCSRCCRGEPGFVFLSHRDLVQLCRHFEKPRNDFLDTYCRSVDVVGIKRVSLKEKPNYDCIFWEGDTDGHGGCSVYEARPTQCRSYPFWASNVGDRRDWEYTGLHCPGIGRGPIHSRREIDRWLRRREREPLLSPEEARRT